MLDRLLDLWTDARNALATREFGSKQRIQFYLSARMLLVNGVGIDETLREVSSIYSERGRKPRNPIARASTAMGKAVANGRPLGEACVRWLPYQESAVIAAGESAGALVPALDECIRVIRSRSKIMQLILAGSLYPLLLWVTLGYLLYTIATQMVPSMARSSNPEHWSGSSYLLYLMANFVTHWGLLTAAGAVLLIVLAMASLPYLNGPLRQWLERVPPWSIYKALQGATFLLNISIMLRANINQVDALESLLRNAKPWMRTRLRAAIFGLSDGKNFGEALRLAGHDFPDRTAIHFLCVLASRPGFSEAINEFSKSWIEETLRRVAIYTGALNLISLLVIGIVILLVLSGVFTIQGTFSSSLH